MWHPEVLPPEWASVAVELDELGLLTDAYMAGGTALALRFGHRVSGDLELMSPVPFSSEETRERLLDRPEVLHLEYAQHTLRAEIRGIQICILHHPHPLLFPTDPLGGLQIADARDVACMTTAAVINRGHRQDFVDLYVAAQEFGLASILDWMDRKYAVAPFERARVLQALTEFSDAEKEPMPELLTPIEWADVRRFFEMSS
jgi:hypothetical protein